MLRYAHDNDESSTKFLVRDAFLGVTSIDLAFLLLKKDFKDGLAEAEDLVCDVLDLVLKPAVAAMRESPLKSYAEGCDRSIAYAVGWLVKEGRAAALQSIA